jgi:hypothetical protein
MTASTPPAVWPSSWPGSQEPLLGLSAVTVPAILAAAAAPTADDPSATMRSPAGPRPGPAGLEQASAPANRGPHNAHQRCARLADHTHRSGGNAPRGRARRDHLPRTGHQTAPDRTQHMTCIRVGLPA